MSEAKRVCFFADSSVRKLVSSLEGNFELLPVERGAALAPLLDRPTVWLADAASDDLEQIRHEAQPASNLRIIAVLKDAKKPLAGGDGLVFAYLPRRTSEVILEKAIASAFDAMELAERERQAQEELGRATREIDELNKIGVALSATRDTEQLLNLILSKCRQITRSDAGSLYVVEEVSETEKRLRFKLTQNDSIPVRLTEFTMPISTTSIAGYVALTGEILHIEDAYNLPPELPLKFNKKVDQESGYRTKSMLTVPMKNQKGEVLGVVQLINCKRNFEARLSTPELVEGEVVPYPKRLQELADSLASQAAVAYENSVLYASIQTLFEGFVKAAVTAIEQRDPTTSGHSFRVSKLTVGLAEVVDKVDLGPYATVHFTPDEMKEIRYAALLHDFGKVGVREEVLVKAKKLYPHQLELVRQRFDYVKKAVESRHLRRKFDFLIEKNREEALAQLQVFDQEYEHALAELDEYLEFVLQVNEPTVLPEGKFELLLDIAKKSFPDPHGVERQLLSPDEVRYLSIPKGSLDPDERVQIESHVIHTFNFLSQIPWTKEIRAIPIIARAHHEKLDGTGYPYRLHETEIPVQSKMMTISDIFDALSASDRPYKRAVPTEKALDILAQSVKHNELDSVLFQLFLDAKIFQLTTKK